MTQYKFNQLSSKSRTSTSLTSCWLNPKTNTLQPGIWKLQKWAIFGELFPFPGCSRLPHILRAALNFVFTEVFQICLILCVFVQQLLFPLSCLLVSNINWTFNPLSFPCFRLSVYFAYEVFNGIPSCILPYKYFILFSLHICMESVHTEKYVKKYTVLTLKTLQIWERGMMNNSHPQQKTQQRLHHKLLDFGNGGRSAS